MRQKTKEKIAFFVILLLMSCSTVFANTVGTAETFYNGTQSIVCDTCSPVKFIECPQGMYRLWEVRPTVNGSSVIIHTKREKSSNGISEFISGTSKGDSETSSE